jgi:hypothetical protein
MIVVLVVVSLYGGVATVPMSSEADCKIAADKFNLPMSRSASAYCVSGAISQDERQ